MGFPNLPTDFVKLAKIVSRGSLIVQWYLTNIVTEWPPVTFTMFYLLDAHTQGEGIKQWHRHQGEGIIVGHPESVHNFQQSVGKVGR